MTAPTSIGRPGARARARATKLRSTVERLLPADVVAVAEVESAPEAASASTNGQHATTTDVVPATPTHVEAGGGRGGPASGFGASIVARASETGARLRDASPDQPLLVQLGLRRALEPQLPASFVHARPPRRSDTGIDPRAISIALTILTAVAMFPLLMSLAEGHADGTGSWTSFLPGYGESPDRAERWGLAVGAAGPLLLLIPLDAFYSAVVDYVVRRRGIARRRDAGLARDRALLAEELAWQQQREVPNDASATPGFSSTRRHLEARATSTGDPGEGGGGTDGQPTEQTDVDDASTTADPDSDGPRDGADAGEAASTDGSAVVADGDRPDDEAGYAGPSDPDDGPDASPEHADGPGAPRYTATPHSDHDDEAGEQRAASHDTRVDDSPAAVRAAAVRLADQLDAEAELSTQIAAVLETTSAWYTIHDGTCDDVGFPHLVLGPSTALLLPSPAGGRDVTDQVDAMVTALTGSLGSAPAVIHVGDDDGAVPVEQLGALVDDLPEILPERAAASRRLVELTGATPRDGQVAAMLERVRAAKQHVAA